MKLYVGLFNLSAIAFTGEKILRLLYNFGFMLLGVATGLSQTVVSGIAVDVQNNKPLPFVHVSINNGESGVISDLDGYFEITTDSGEVSLRLTYVGYQSHSLLVEVPEEGLNLRIEMHRASVEFDEVVVYAGENPTHRLIRGLYNKREKHHPDNYFSYRYLAYNKLWSSVGFDSTLLARALEESDTSELNQTISFFNSQYLFLLESVVANNYRRSSGSREEVIATRSSGFKNPIFIILGTEMQSFSFYDSEFNLGGVTYKNPISRNFERYYEFHMRDTVFHDHPTDTTFIVAFYPVEGRNFPGLKGLLYIRVPDFAIENVMAAPANDEDGDFGDQFDFQMEVSIRQQYAKIKGQYWFPKQLNTDFTIKFNKIEMDGMDVMFQVRTYLDSIEVNLSQNRIRPGPVDVLVNPAAGTRDEEFWEKYRYHPLDTVALRTYHIMDSIGQEYQFDRILKGFLTLISGKITLGKIDFELTRLFRYNVFEGLRLGGGLRTNREFSRVLELGGWYGYGFRDKLHKFGGDVGILFNEKYQIRWTTGFERELIETGGFSLFYERGAGWFNNGFRPFFISTFDLQNRYYSAIELHPRANFKTRVILQKENRTAFGDYSFVPIDVDNPIREFYYTTLGFDWSYAPGDRYLQGIMGRQRINFTHPRFYLSYQHGLNGVLGGEFDFHRIIASVRIKKSLSAFGSLSVELTSAAIFGEQLPYNLLFNGRYNYVKGKFFNRIIGADLNSFETMRPVEFTSDRFFMWILRYDFSSLLFSPNVRKSPHLEVLYRGMWGRLKVDTDIHQEVILLDPSRVYHETGVEVNRIYNSLGVGAYYRIGPYARSTFEKNLSLRLTAKFVF